VERVALTGNTGTPKIRNTALLRGRLPFRSVNKPGKPGYRAGMQRHHLLPRQLLLDRKLRQLFDSVGCDLIGFDDFRCNGLLLPALEQAAMVLGLPLHRGPHRRYNEVVAERMGQIEAGWQAARARSPDLAAREVLMRMHLLQRALRRSLLLPGLPRIRLNSRDPLGKGVDFSELDAMAESIWTVTAPLEL
jgi:hypothetical protein